MAKKKPTPPERTHPVPLSHYHEAVQRNFEWAPSDYEAREAWPNGPVYVKHGDKVYQVDSGHDIREHAKLLLDKGEMAYLLPPNWCPDLMEEVHYATDFYWNLLPSLASDPLKLTQLQTALTISQISLEPIQAFWYSLHQLSFDELYPAAIEAAAETYGQDVLASEVLEFMTDPSRDFLNEMQGGTLESVCLNDDPTEAEAASDAWADRNFFYIYSKDPINWEAKNK